MRVRPAFY